MKLMAYHVDKEVPLEACGLLAGLEYKSMAVFPIKNILESPIRYRMDPKEQFEKFLVIEKQGWELLGIYHSHPLGPSGPSQTDLEEATYPDSVYLILSPSIETWQCIGFTILAKQATEVKIIIA